MHRFFESTIRPLLDVTDLDTIVEVGADQAIHTSRLLPYVRARGAHLHIIDPVSHFRSGPFRERFGSYATVHAQTSHDALPRLAAPDVVLLDGDHNWYTVIEELRIMERTWPDWPLTFLHDLEWPYARRDMYYAPERIPAEFRHPYACAGIVHGRSELVENGGRNPQLANAMHEGGPRNGVLTAVEDFIDETPRDLVLFAVSGNNGLGILFDRSRLSDRPFARVLRRCARPRVMGRKAVASGA